MIDPELVNRKIVLISQDLRDMQALAQKPRESFLESRIDETLAERYLERVIGRIIDINFHIITESGNPPPRDYHDSFLQLGTLRVLPAEFARKVAACAGLRNRIVHEYDEIDPAKLYEGLQAAARDIPHYLANILAFLKGLPAS
jgi:uncharacterized protein YutE (UPF0331/DUF86 family)